MAILNKYNYYMAHRKYNLKTEQSSKIIIFRGGEGGLNISLKVERLLGWRCDGVGEDCRVNQHGK